MEVFLRCVVASIDTETQKRPEISVVLLWFFKANSSGIVFIAQGEDLKTTQNHGLGDRKQICCVLLSFLRAFVGWRFYPRVQ